MATPIEKLYSIRLGVQGENATTPIEIDMTSWLEEFPTARLHIMFKRYNDNYPYPVITEFDHPILRWIPTVTDTEYIGVGYAEILALDPETDLVKKSRVVPTAVENSVTGAYGQLPVPSPFENWVNQVLAAKDAVDEVASDIEGSAEAAEAAQAAAEAARDAAQAAAGDFQGLSATASGLATGTAPTVNVTHNEGGLYNLAFGIPKGDKGDQGDPAPAEQVAPAVDAYLAENFTNPSNPPLDRSLSSELSAAPADMVGDLKSAITEPSYNLYAGKIAGATIASNGKIGASTLFDMFKAPVEAGKTYSVRLKSTTESSFIAYFENEPTAVGDVSYNGTRIAINAGMPFTAPITGWLIYREDIGFDQPQINEGTLLPYAKNLTAIDYTARGKLDSIDGIETGTIHSSAVPVVSTGAGKYVKNDGSVGTSNALNISDPIDLTPGFTITVRAAGSSFANISPEI